LPIPSLNEVNYLAFGEADEEYHNELYGYIDSQEILSSYSQGKPKIEYSRLLENGKIKKQKITMTEYIRHQIHHPENNNNEKFTNDELQQSIRAMREFIEEWKGNK
ncbi:MAG: ATP/GTP-binding protein, partial [Campylobacter sp.]|nr:ATP/GTP-binding protein [Campylobacter sp.]